jgi:hypothetical protein
LQSRSKSREAACLMLKPNKSTIGLHLSSRYRPLGCLSELPAA